MASAQSAAPGLEPSPCRTTARDYKRGQLGWVSEQRKDSRAGLPEGGVGARGPHQRGTHHDDRKQDLRLKFGGFPERGERVQRVQGVDARLRVQVGVARHEAVRAQLLAGVALAGGRARSAT